jgi:hypothetical protein
MTIVQILSLVVCIIFFCLIIDFIRRGLLKEKYAVLWLASLAFVFILALWKGLLDTVAIKLGVAYPPSLLFLVAFIFVILMLLHFSVVISILTNRTKTLAQEIALLKQSMGDKSSGDNGGSKEEKEEV